MQTKNTPPVVKDLSSIYPDGFVESQNERYLKLKQKFKQVYNVDCDFIARAPGRVNLIGEHIDYMGYGVLPMAIVYDTIIATRFIKKQQGKYTITIHNLDPKWPSKSFEFEKTFEINAADKHWTNYVLCGIKGIMDYAKLEELGGDLQLVVHGTVPSASGLSSSSALTCASALAAMHAFGLQMSKEDVAHYATVSERYVGLLSGGMDQAISLLAEKGYAKHVEFNPLRASTVVIPDGIQFVVSHSLVSSEKLATSNYNQRVVECRLGAAILGKKLNVHGWDKKSTLIELQQKLKKTLKEMAKHVNEHLREIYTLKDVCKELELEENQLLSIYIPENLKVNFGELKIRDRCLHVFNEAQRVWDFKDACNENNITKLGDLINDSHFSNRDLYEASCPDLEKLTTICRNAGALGSRFTGAGWGGCVVSLVKDDMLSPFMEKVWQEYYLNYKKVKDVNKEEIHFASKPSGGAAIII